MFFGMTGGADCVWCTGLCLQRDWGDTAACILLYCPMRDESQDNKNRTQAIVIGIAVPGLHTGFSSKGQSSSVLKMGVDGGGVALMIDWKQTCLCIFTNQNYFSQGFSSSAPEKGEFMFEPGSVCETIISVQFMFCLKCSSDSLRKDLMLKSISFHVHSCSFLRSSSPQF